MQVKSYYQILNIPEKASSQELKAAFRQLALTWHPDKNRESPGAAAVFKVIHNAYSVLADPAARQVYDEYLKTSSGFSRSQAAAAAGHTPEPVISGLPDFTPQAIFSQLNILLWDLEDFLRVTEERAFLISFSGQLLRFYVVKVLDFINKWLFNPAEPENYLAGIFNITRGLLQNYFYYVRLKSDKLFNGLSLADLNEPVSGFPLTRIDCILEVQQHTFHYLHYIRLAAAGQIGEIPVYRYSLPVFTD